MAFNNEMVTSLKGTLFRVITCSVRHAVTHLSTLPQARLTHNARKRSPKGREVVTCCPLDSSILICGFLHCLEWTPALISRFSNLHPMALKTQKYVLHISQMHQHQTLVNPSGVGYPGYIAICPAVNTLFRIICSELKKIVKNPWLLLFNF